MIFYKRSTSVRTTGRISTPNINRDISFRCNGAEVKCDAIQRIENHAISIAWECLRLKIVYFILEFFFFSFPEQEREQIFSHKNNARLQIGVSSIPNMLFCESISFIYEKWKMCSIPEILRMFNEDKYGYLPSVQQKYAFYIT